ncbi:hypothetical protein [Virgisporangium ochraceum]|uniref:Uncharacterized protein n=1 Tax=Virgisporangium ochraceum TaxID=65505 RepID=A0A8J4A067_9ACTN|nr:hypothetical protein [Virgisporangium ochraceum]GIJ72483.1 hypothetical protein Voc01_074000 [Virgisporangium ochraceum]
MTWGVMATEMLFPVGVFIVVSGMSSMALVVRVLHAESPTPMFFRLRRSGSLTAFVGPAGWRSVPRDRLGWLAMQVAPLAVVLCLTYVIALWVPLAAAGASLLAVPLAVVCLAASAAVVAGSLVYAATFRLGAWAPRLGLPPLDLPAADFHTRVRTKAALNLFWYRYLHVCTVFSGLYAVLASAVRALQVAAGDAAAAVKVSALVGAVAGWTLVVCTTAIGVRVVASYFPVTRAHRAIGRCLAREPAGALRAYDPRLPADPLVHRPDLVDAGRCLIAVARRLEHPTGTVGVSHPLATLLRATERKVGLYLASRASLTDRLPEELRNTLRLATTVMVGPRRHGRYGELAALVAPFDPDGQPHEVLRPPAPGRVGLLVAQVADGVERAHRVIFGLAWTALLVAVIFAVVHQGRGLEWLLQIVKP